MHSTTARTPRWPGVAFAGTILVGAFLLFQVQPLISKFILPWFGGVPAVWTTCMLFFQVLLFAGYSYAHLAGSRFSLRTQAAAQIAILLAAAVFLPIAPNAAWKPAGSDAPAWRILLLLLCSVGLPYFVLSTTSPLVQVWFTRSYPGQSPYRLYALSNFGSLVALLSYPFVFEPAFDLPAQSWLWSGTFAVYILLCGGCAVWVWRLAGRARVTPAADDPAGAAAPGTDHVDSRPACVSWLRRAAWVLLPACASLLLLATTNHVCQDVAVVPFLWVVPLALYLVSFIVCFDHSRWYVRGLWGTLAVLSIVAVSGTGDIESWLNDYLHANGFLHADFELSYAETLGLLFANLFFICMVCHGELVRLRPDPQHLTEYYLLISLGGALGGVAVSLVAPQVFTTFFEWECGLLISYILAAVVLGLGLAELTVRQWHRLAAHPDDHARPALSLLATSALVAVALFGLATILQWQASGAIRETVQRARNFYGFVSVREYDTENAEHRFQLRHGGITHGEQLAVDGKRHLPLTYYTHESGAGRAITFLQGERPAMRVGVVGLGVGSLAAYARRGDVYRFYEINPIVQRLAEDRRYFTYLSDARQRGAAVDIVLGDARLSLDRQPPQQFDVLALDAFSGDSIPAHLLTQEAFAIYRKHRAPGGVIAVHCTNSYLYLAPVVRGLAEDCGLPSRRIYQTADHDRYVYDSDWFLLTDNRKLLDALRDVPPPPDYQDDFRVPLWTDRYSNLFQILQ